MKLIDNLLVICCLAFFTIVIAGFLFYFYMEVIAEIAESSGFHKVFLIGLVITLTAVLVLFLIKFILLIMGK